MSGEKAVIYDHASSIFFVNTLQIQCGLLAGFAFTGTLVLLTRLGDPSAFLSQLVLVILYLMIHVFLGAYSELHIMNLLVSMRSPKRIIPNYLDRWRIINAYLNIGPFLVYLSVSIMFLVNKLTILFILTFCITILGNATHYFRRWKPIYQEFLAKEEKLSTSKV